MDSAKADRKEYHMQAPVQFTDDLTTAVHRTICSDHGHLNCEILLETSGSVTSWVNGNPDNLKHGDIRFLNNRVVHALTDPSHDHEHYDIYISIETLRELCLALFDEALFTELTEAQQEIPIWASSADFNYTVTRVTDLDFRYGLEDSPDRKEAYSKCIRAVVASILSIYYEQTRLSRSNAPKWLIEFLRSIKAPDVFDMTIEQIVAESGYSHPRFCALFKQYFGYSFKSYIDKLRMNYACNMLVSTDCSILDVSMTVGYANSSHFIKRFKEEYGVSPGAYRSMHLK